MKGFGTKLNGGKVKNLTWHNSKITKEQRAKIKKQKPCILWFTGLSGSGKSTIAAALEEKLFELGYHTYILDGDNIRHGLCKDLSFDKKSRKENIRRVGEVSKLFVESGLIILVALISPFREDRNMVRNLVNSNEFIEIYVNTSLDICETRDVKGLYKKAREGKIKNFTGINSPYEEPLNPEIILYGTETIEQNVNKIINYLFDNKYLFK